MSNFYKSAGSYYTSDTNTKILNLNDLQGLAKAGGKEISAPTAPTGSQAISNPGQIPNYNVTANIGGTLYGTLKAPSNTINSNTLNAGINSGNVSSQLPNSNDLAANLYADRSLLDATKQQTDLQKTLDQEKAQRIKDTQTQLDTAQANKDTQIANYDTQMNPLKDKAVGIYDSMLNSIKDTNYSDLVKTKLELTNDIVNYSKMMKEELDASAGQSGLQSLATGRQNVIKENYTSKIAIAQASQSAIDGNFNLAFDIMDKGANAINNLTTDRINFINTVKGLFDNKINTLTATEKQLLDQAQTDAQTKLDNLQKNKDTIMGIMTTNPIIANKAGLSLTDTPEVLTKKLNDFYVKNPQYTPDNQAFIKKAMEKYYDAGITMNDPIATIQSKIQNSQTYQRENGGKFTMTTDPLTGQPIVFNTSTGAISNGSVQIPQSSRLASVNNNPGNLRFAGQAGATQGEGGFAKFETPEAGYQALIAQIQLDASRGLTLSQFINKYAPPSENNTGLYISQISKATGANNNTPISQIDVNILAQAMAMKESGTVINTKANTGNPSVTDNVKNWAIQVTNGQRKFTDIPKELQTEVNNYMAQNGSITKTDAEANAKLQDKITQIDDLIKQTSNSGAVGPNPFARTSLTSWFTGTRQAFVGSIKQLLSKETIDTLLNLKKGGGTLGALSDQERIMLQTAATKIGGWEMKDKNGNGTGFYNVREKDFIKELENIKSLAKRAVDNAGGQTGIINTLEQNLAANPARVDEYNKLVADNPNLTEDDINQLMGFTQ